MKLEVKSPTLETFLLLIINDEHNGKISDEEANAIAKRVKDNHPELLKYWQANVFTFSHEFYNTVWYFFVQETKSILKEREA